jgi:polysaccharide export outer membrane protein
MHSKIRLLLLSSLLLLLAGFSSCVDSKHIVYFNNIQDTVLKAAALAPQPVIQTSDLLSINTSSLNPDASAVFNQSGGGSSATSSMMMSSSSFTGALTPTGGLAVAPPTGGQQNGYLVDQDGFIKYPVVGNIKAAGLTKQQLEAEITDTLVARKLLVDPVITVHFLNFRVTVLGEVMKPSTINVANERISILEALGLAGDLTIYAKRENVLLVREDGDKKIIRRIDLTSPNILTSPYYYLKTNDIIYVEPNKAKIASSERSTQLLPIWLSALSLIAVIFSYIIFK